MVINALIAYFPFMIANAMPIFIAKGTPLDFGKLFFDNKRILGDSKTFEGLINGLLFGTTMTSFYAIISSNSFWIIYGFMGSLGALAGDMINSFIKRRIGKKTGEQLPILDQINFILGATLFIKILNLDVIVSINIDLKTFIIALVISYFLHRLTNYYAYKLGIKKVPW